MNFFFFCFIKEIVVDYVWILVIYRNFTHIMEMLFNIFFKFIKNFRLFSNTFISHHAGNINYKYKPAIKDFFQKSQKIQTVQQSI